MLTPEQASDIASRHGLTIADAVSLRVLADDTAEAESIAARFATSDEAKFAAHLFAKADDRSRRVEVKPKDSLGTVTAKLLGPVHPPAT